MRPLVPPGTYKVYLFRTPHSEGLARDLREGMVDVALAITAAPMFLPAKYLRGLGLFDGGLWANNQAVVAIAEAVSEFGVYLVDIRALSLGTTSDLGVRAKASRSRTRLSPGRRAPPRLSSEVGASPQAMPPTTWSRRANHFGSTPTARQVSPTRRGQPRRTGGASRGGKPVRQRAGEADFLDHRAGPYVLLHTPGRSTTP